jgi:hypothetical protein
MCLLLPFPVSFWVSVKYEVAEEEVKFRDNAFEREKEFYFWIDSLMRMQAAVLSVVVVNPT